MSDLLSRMVARASGSGARVEPILSSQYEPREAQETPRPEGRSEESVQRPSGELRPVDLASKDDEEREAGLPALSPALGDGPQPSERLKGSGSRKFPPYSAVSSMAPSSRGT